MLEGLILVGVCIVAKRAVMALGDGALDCQCVHLKEPSPDLTKLGRYKYLVICDRTLLRVARFSFSHHLITAC